MNASESDRSFSDVEKIPEEVWSMVFTYLTFEDRKSVRLTCRHFYDACNQVNFQKSETIAFYNDFIDVNAVLQCLADSKRKLWNIKLKMVPLVDPSIASFFSIQGPNVQSLILDRCIWVPGILRDIIKSCVNLRNFVLLFDHEFPMHVQAWKCIVDDFRSLQKDGIVCENVVSFTLQYEHTKPYSRISNWYHSRPKSLVTNENLLLFFDVFPNIKDLNMTLCVSYNFNQLSTNSSDIMSSQVLSLSCIHFLVSKMRYQLEKLKLRFIHDVTRLYLCLQLFTEISVIQFDKLKEFALNGNNVWDTKVENPLLTFKNLTHFDCHILYETSIDISDFIQLLLNTASELSVLTIRVCKEFRISNACLRALVNSKLTTLNIYNSGLLFHHHPPIITDPLKGSYLAPNHSLKHFRIYAFEIHSDELLFYEYFRSLQTLVLELVNEDVLHHLIKYQRHLVRLILHSQEPVFWYSLLRWFKNENLSSYRCREHLVHLHITESSSYDLTTFLLNELEFPVLKTLTMDFCTCRFEEFELLWRSILKLCRLECLMISWSFETSLPRWLTLLKALPKLRYVHIWDRCHLSLLSDSEYRQFFRVNSSLRLFVHFGGQSFTQWGTKNFVGVKYVRDMGTNTVRQIEIDSNCTMREGIPDHHFDEIVSAFKDNSSFYRSFFPFCSPSGLPH